MPTPAREGSSAAPARLRELSVRVGLRILAGVALYALLLPLWLWAGLDGLYDDLTLEAGAALVPALVHFPLSASQLEPATLHNQGHTLVLVLSFFLVCTRIPWRDRVRRYGVILVLVVSSHILGFAIQFVIALGLKFEGRAHVPLFLPWELTLLARTFQLAFAFGLQIASFLAVALTAFWCSGSTVRGLFGDEGPDDEPEPAVLAPPGRWSRWARPQILLPAGALLLVGTAGLVWWVREVDPRHAKVHTVLANTFFANGQWIEAEEQYRAAIRGGASDGPTWYGLAGVASRRGDHALAVERLERALEVVTDRAWRGRLESALSRARAGRPFLDLRE